MAQAPPRARGVISESPGGDAHEAMGQECGGQPGRGCLHGRPGPREQELGAAGNEWGTGGEAVGRRGRRTDGEIGVLPGGRAVPRRQGPRPRPGPCGRLTSAMSCSSRLRLRTDPLLAQAPRGAVTWGRPSEAPLGSRHHCGQSRPAARTTLARPGSRTLRGRPAARLAPPSSPPLATGAVVTSSRAPPQPLPASALAGPEQCTVSSSSEPEWSHT